MWASGLTKRAGERESDEQAIKRASKGAREQMSKRASEQAASEQAMKRDGDGRGAHGDGWDDGEG